MIKINKAAPTIPKAKAQGASCHKSFVNLKNGSKLIGGSFHFNALAAVNVPQGNEDEKAFARESKPVYFSLLAIGMSKAAF
jgi:hypothetical protein